jgi:hypothetical protein
MRTTDKYHLINLSLISISKQILSRILSIAVKLPYFLCAMVPPCGGMIAAASRKVSNREGKAMMLLIRSAFWLMIIILLLPTDAQQQSKVYGTAEATVKDVVTFCDRNPDTCTTGRDAFQVLVQKAEFGARFLMGFIKEQTGTGESASGDSASSDASDVSAAAIAPASWDKGTSQDTLSPEDRETAWGGPDGAGT